MLELDQGPRPCHVELWPSKVVRDGKTMDGWLTFQDPTGADRNESIAITTGPTRDDVTGDGVTVIKRWHWEDQGDRGTTHPSILLAGVYHIAPGAIWLKTEANPDGSWPREGA